MNARTLILLALSAVAQSCAPAMPVLRASDATRAAVTASTVEAQVESVSLPLVNSPSIAGDRATAILRIVSGALPQHPHARRVQLAWDPHGGLALEPGAHVSLRFDANGRLAEIVVH